MSKQGPIRPSVQDAVDRDRVGVLDAAREVPLACHTDDHVGPPVYNDLSGQRSSPVATEMETPYF